MKFKTLLLSLLLTGSISSYAADFRYVGGDISLYPTYQTAGSQYKDTEGNNIQLLPYLYDIGMNAMRVRLFVDPDKFIVANPQADPNACQSLPYIIPLCKDIVAQGFDLMLDFHYSDTWADPGAQWIPERWKGLSDAVLADSVYNYTKNTLLTLKANDITPKFIQPGNEISYGMLWAEYGGNPDANKVYINQREDKWERFGSFLKAGISACREVCPDAEIVIHTERVAQVNVLTGFYQQMAKLNIDYDIIGLSYYPYFHGKMSVLDAALSALEKQYPDKPIMIVETGYPYKWEVPGTNQSVDYPYSYEGQEAFASALINTLLAHPNVNGLFWWWLEYNAFGTKLEGWYNSPLFDSNNGKATPAIKTIASFGTGHDAVETIEAETPTHDNRWYDINGRVVNSPDHPGIYIHNNKKILVK
ncbi:MAG: glycosyl hydrolase 53 family protein [Muribaculaceae bacterium]|nr:glycosyl hydrolase 53 family protein [Muribaculaceae bacterium]